MHHNIYNTYNIVKKYNLTFLYNNILRNPPSLLTNNANICIYKNYTYNPTRVQGVSTPLIKAKNLPGNLEEYRTFKEELQSKYQQKQALLYLLENVNVLKYDPLTGEKIRKEFFPYMPEPSQTEIDLFLSEDDLKQEPHFHLGLLEINPDTFLLSNTQKHVIVIYTTIKNQQIVWGFLTSDSSAKLVSEKQPFGDTNKPKKQYVTTLQKPLIVDPIHLKNLISEEAQAKARTFLQDTEVNKKLSQAFCNDIKPKLQKPINVYDTYGITLEQIEKALPSFFSAERILAKKWFSEYKQTSDSEKTDKLLLFEKGKSQHKAAYDYFYQMLNDEKLK